MLEYIKTAIVSLISSIFAPLPVSQAGTYSVLTRLLNFERDIAHLSLYSSVMFLVFSICVFVFLRKIYAKSIKALFAGNNANASTKNYKRFMINILLGLIPALVSFIPLSKGRLVMDFYDSMLSGDNLLMTAFCVLGSGAILLVANWYANQNYASTVRSSKTKSMLRFCFYQIPSYILPGISPISTGATSLILCDVDSAVIVREVLSLVAPATFAVNAVRLVRVLLSGIVLDPIAIAVCVLCSALGTSVVLHFLSKVNFKRVCVFFSIYSILFGILIAAVTFI